MCSFAVYSKNFKQEVKEMKKVNKKVLKVVEHVMRNEAVYGIDRFPPACMEYFISRNVRLSRRKEKDS